MPKGIYERKPRDPAPRFWSHVDKSGDCWLWTAYVNEYGYGTFSVGRQFIYAHRFSYESLVELIPEGFDLDHRVTCPKRCVRPEHLRLATVKQNQENRAGAQVNSKSGIRGVYWDRVHGKWFVQVKHHGKRHFGGLFLEDQLIEAEVAAIALRNQLFTHNDVDREAV